ncbi:hypothetical protein DPEC_G00180860 [Dallia pectoralis]|uniref:Uncharacterized protein n=1 Tax=Dallia pectoralis TaxID=75939 RepID=A0ACC2GA08_DALPE|nr:hypothetical protein DPEC_G00180860 [Dallia pectoralis]
MNAHWRLSDLRRYGAVPNGFVFEGGTRCGYWAGVFFLSSSEGEQISFLFDCIVRGISPSRPPSDVRPNLPGIDPVACRTFSEERISHEASDLERRLSRLSNCSSQSSTASTYSYSTSVAIDDRSSISLSSSSQSDTSCESHFPLWVEPRRPTSSTETLSVLPNGRSSTNPDERLYAAVMNRLPSKQTSCPRGLSDSGRQCSLDSGIGIATTSSQSSYSGSFSSCTGSLDTASQEGGEEFGSLLSLPPPLSPPPHSTPPPSLSVLNTDPRPLPPASPPSTCHSYRTSISSSPYWLIEESQAPSLLQLRYDTPRTLLQSLAFRDPSTQGGAHKPGRDEGGGGHKNQGQGRPSYPSNATEDFLQRVGAPRQAPMQWSRSLSDERAPPLDSGGRCSPAPWPAHPHRPLLLPGCSVCGGTQCRHQCIDQNYITHEQLISAKKRDISQANSLSPSDRLTPSPGGLFPFTLHATTAMRSSLLDRHPYHHSDPSVNYVNIPVSPAAKANASRELLYMELDLLRPGAGPVSTNTTAARGSATRYACINLPATEMAQRVGAEHAQGRRDRLPALEHRTDTHIRRGAAQ